LLEVTERLRKVVEDFRSLSGDSVKELQTRIDELKAGNAERPDNTRKAHRERHGASTARNREERRRAERRIERLTIGIAESRAENERL